MRTPLKSKTGTRSQVSNAQSYPAPVGGWNSRDSLAAMKPNMAIDLINWFPLPTYCEIRGGWISHATDMDATGKTLAVYNGMTGLNKLFCTTASGVFDVSSPGAVGASLASRTNGKHQWVMFGDGTSNYLILCNGVDKPLYYDGATWLAVDATSSPALTGVTSSTLIQPFVFKGRLLFIQANTLSFWYLAAGVAGGALTEFDLSGVAKKGGYLMAAASWTIDAGDGPDDRMVFVTSEGEAIIYAGTNPSDASAWSLVGIYEIGKPLGRRCLVKFGGDLLVLTQNGEFPLSAAIQSASIDYKLAVTNIIENAFTNAARSYGSNFGWETIVFPARSAMIVNVPIAEGGIHEQYVMNTITKAWCKFNGWNAECFAVFNDELYYVDGTNVRRAWAGTSDGGSNIIAYAKTAFSYFGSVDVNKRFNMFRPVIATNGSLSFLTDIDVDFNDTEISGSTTYSVINGARWDIDSWDSAYWASGLQVIREWTSPDEYMGYSAAGKIKISTNSLVVQWMACDYIYEHGGPL